MRPLPALEELQAEAGSAVFTKQQAVAVTLQILNRELQSAESPEEAELLQRAMQKAEFRYLDGTNSATDKMLDELGVARFVPADIVNAMNALLFDAE